MPLDSSQRKYLRGLAHALKPVVELGKSGLTPATVTAIAAALARHELIKVRLVGTRADKLAQADRIAAETSSELVGLVGHVGTFYRESPEEKRRRIRVPPARQRAGAS